MKVPLGDDVEVREGEINQVDFLGRPVVLLRVNGEVRAYVNVCTHLGGPVELKDGSLQCSWHGACFDPSTGKATKGPAAPGSKLIRLPTRVEDGKVLYVYGET